MGTRIAIGADHAGFPLNERVITELRAAGHELIDFGTHDGSQPDDYPDYAKQIGEVIQQGDAEIGILICGSGVGAAGAVVLSQPKPLPCSPQLIKRLAEG